MSRRRSQPPRPDARPCVHPHAAGLDIGREEIWACVPEDRDAQPVRSFGTFTPDLLALAEWLVSCRIETVAERVAQRRVQLVGGGVVGLVPIGMVSIVIDRGIVDSGL